jgi:hypothetical protein
MGYIGRGNKAAIKRTAAEKSFYLETSLAEIVQTLGNTSCYKELDSSNSVISPHNLRFIMIVVPLELILLVGVIHVLSTGIMNSSAKHHHLQLL